MNDNQIIDGALNYLADFVKNYSAMAGTIKMFAGSIAPDGWLLCNGQAVSRTTYSKLFNVIGTTYGEGDGSTTFNVPDLRGRTPVGVGTGTATGATAHTLGQKAGVESSSYTPAGTIGGTAITQAQLPAISASVNVRNVANASYNMLTSTTGKFTVAEQGDATNAVALGTVQNQIQKLTFSVGSGNTHTHSWTGTATTINNMQPYLAVNYIICTGDDLDLNPSTNPEYRYGEGTVTVPVASSGSPLVLLATLPEGLWEVKLRCTWPSSAGTINKNFGIYRTDLGCGTGFYANASGASTGYCADTISRTIKIDGTTPSERKNVYLYAWHGGNSEVEITYGYQIVQLGGVVDRDYDYPIGEIRQTSGTVSIASSASTKIKVDTLPKGIWLLSSRANYAANTTGERSLGVRLGDVTSTGYSRIPAAGNSGVNTSVTAHRVIEITDNTINRDIDLSFWQNSGSTLDVTYSYYATQIGGNVETQYINGAVFGLQSVTVTGSSIAAGSTAWQIIDAPENAVSLVGWYVDASAGSNSLANVYAARYDVASSSARVAIRNNGTTALTPVVTAQFLCLTNTQPVFVDTTYSDKVDNLINQDKIKGTVQEFPYSVSVPANSERVIKTLSLPAGLWLIISHMGLSTGSGTSVYNHTLGGRTVRASEVNGGGSMNLVIRQHTETTNVELKAYSHVACTVGGSIYVINLGNALFEKMSS